MKDEYISRAYLGFHAAYTMQCSPSQCESFSFVNIFIAAVYETLLLKEALGNYVLHLIISDKTLELGWSCPIVCLIAIILITILIIYLVYITIFQTTVCSVFFLNKTRWGKGRDISTHYLSPYIPLYS